MLERAWKNWECRPTEGCVSKFCNGTTDHKSHLIHCRWVTKDIPLEINYTNINMIWMQHRSTLVYQTYFVHIKHSYSLRWKQHKYHYYYGCRCKVFQATNWLRWQLTAIILGRLSLSPIWLISRKAIIRVRSELLIWSIDNKYVFWTPSL